MPNFKPVPRDGPFLVTKRERVAPQVHDALCAAIDTRQQISFMYQGQPRVVEPHDYGMQNERERLLAYQIGGGSSSGRLPDWRWFDVVKITGLKVLDEAFAGNREVPSGRNHRWDKVFARVGEPE
jgi:hypothetical protein